MDFKNVVTYGRFKNRVIKTDLWISPQVQRNRLFASTSSESSMNNSSLNKSRTDSAVSVDPERASESLSSEKLSSPTQSVSGEDTEDSCKSLSNGLSQKSLSQLASSKKNDNDSVLVEHSTPYSGRSLITVRPRRLPVISPLVIAESPLKAHGEQFDSPNLFSDTSHEHCDLLADENGDTCPGMCITTNRNEARSNAANQNKHVHNSTNKNEDKHITANDKIDSYNTANNVADSSAKLNIEFDVSENNIHKISDKKNSSSLSDSDSTQYNLKSNQNVLKRSEDKIIECTAAQNHSTETKFFNGHESPEVVCAENNSHLDEICKCTCTKNAPYEIEKPPRGCKDSDNSLPEISEKVTDFPSENFENLNKNQGQNNSTNAVRHISYGQFPQETNPISDKDSSKVLQRESLQEDANTIKNYQEDSELSAHNPKPANSTNMRLLDAKVYLNRNEGLWSSGSVRVNNHPNISAPENSLSIGDVNGEVHVYPATHSRNDLHDLPTGKIHPPSYYPEDDLPPMLSQLPTLSTGNVHPSNPDVNSEPTENSLNRNGFSEEVTPKNFDTRTPLTGQHTGKVVKNPNYSSFVDALTPARFQQDRKRPLSAKEKILVQCDQQKPMKFTEVLSASVLSKCVKVGEGTYGEVYKTNDGVEDVALKVIPIEGNFTVNDEPQKSFEDMIPEIVISKELSNLCECDDVRDSVHVCWNFVKVKRVMLVQDSYPEKLLQEWNSWKNNHDSENERPDMFQSDQYFIVFEFVDGGVDLERFQFNSMEEALSVLQQVAISLSVAEESLMFEHRDLHWGNVLIKRTKCKKIHYKLGGDDICVESAGVFVSIIDFTLSRLTKDGLTVYCDLSKDPDIFKGKGDYQFQVYRLMRKENSNDWESHKPYSNVLWIRYLIDKMLNSKEYKKANNSIQRSMRKYLRQVLSYESAAQAVNDGFLGLDIRNGL